MCRFFSHIMTLLFILHFQHDNPYLYLEARSLAPARRRCKQKVRRKEKSPKNFEKTPLDPSLLDRSCDLA